MLVDVDVTTHEGKEFHRWKILYGKKCCRTLVLKFSLLNFKLWPRSLVLVFSLNKFQRFRSICFVIIRYVQMNDATTLYTLSFADDQIVIAQDTDDMEYMTRKLIEEYGKWGLEVNLDKTEYMCIGEKQQDLNLLSGQKIKHCNVYKYLGLKITNDGSLDEAISERNVQGRRAISMLNSVLWDGHITKENKKRIYNAIVRSIIMYSCEVWPLKEKTERTLRATEMDYWRRAAGKSRMDRVTNENIRRLMGIQHDIVDEIRTRQLVWYGHVQRMTENRIPRKIMQWTPQGRRRRGRPRRSWREGIDSEMRERGVEDDMWRDRDTWRLGIGRRRKTL